MRPRLLLVLFNAIALVLGVVWDVAADTDGMRQHVRCPVDGEMLHADAAEAGAPSKLEAARPSDHGHGCELAKMGNPPQPIHVPAALAWVVPEVFETLIVSPNTEARGPPVAVLAFAPKMSPPRG